jgi:hypothetical protein
VTGCETSVSDLRDMTQILPDGNFIPDSHILAPQMGVPAMQSTSHLAARVCGIDNTLKTQTETL